MLSMHKLLTLGFSVKATQTPTHVWLCTLRPQPAAQATPTEGSSASTPTPATTTSSTPSPGVATVSLALPPAAETSPPLEDNNQAYEFNATEERLLRTLTEASSTAGLALGLQAFVTVILGERWDQGMGSEEQKKPPIQAKQIRKWHRPLVSLGTQPPIYSLNEQPPHPANSPTPLILLVLVMRQPPFRPVSACFCTMQQSRTLAWMTTLVLLATVSNSPHNHLEHQLPHSKSALSMTAACLVVLNTVQRV